jgi:hypothetical protein
MSAGRFVVSTLALLEPPELSYRSNRMLSQSLIATNVNNLAHPDGYRIVILYSPSSQVSSLRIATDPGFLMQPIYAPIDGNVAFACSGIGAQTSTDPLGAGD